MSTERVEQKTTVSIDIPGRVPICSNKDEGHQHNRRCFPRRGRRNRRVGRVHRDWMFKNMRPENFDNEFPRKIIKRAEEFDLRQDMRKGSERVFRVVQSPIEVLLNPPRMLVPSKRAA